MTSRDDVLVMGIGRYNEECRGIITRYLVEWEEVVSRTGRWINFKNGYKTMDPSFMESVWWVFARLYAKGLVYRGFKVMPYSTGCKTPLANFEAGHNYKEVSDPAIMVAFPLVGDPYNASLVAWTITPWTLPSNLALCVNKSFIYVKVRDKLTGATYIVAESLLSSLPVKKPKADGTGSKHNSTNSKFKDTPDGNVKGSKQGSTNSKSNSKDILDGKTKGAVDTGPYELLGKVERASLVGMRVPLEDFHELRRAVAWAGLPQYFSFSRLLGAPF